jgi:hypothetical protein
MRCPKCGSVIDSQIVITKMEVQIQTFKEGYSPEKGEFKSPKYRPKPVA